MSSVRFTVSLLVETLKIMILKNNIVICLLALLTLGACQSKKEQKEEIPLEETLPPDVKMVKGICKMQDSHVTDTVSWRGKLYTYDIKRTADENLPTVKDETDGLEYYDNQIDLKITQGEKTVFEKHFLKSSFDSYLDNGFRKSGMLEALVFDMTVPEGLRFATSVSYPQSDLYLPLLIIIDAEGNMTIKRDNVLDTYAQEEEEDGV